MQLNAAETLLMNNPVRAAVQRYYEAPRLERLGGRVDGGRVLEVGCGRGVGTQLIIEHFGAASVDAFDIDPAMVRRAARRLTHLGDRVRLSVGDVTSIDAGDDAYDTVFDFGIIHHVPVWRDAVAEVARVLRPGGRFFFEEVTKHALDRWSYRTFLDHPDDDRFSGDEFIAALENAGIIVKDRSKEVFFGDFVIGVGEKA